MLCEHKCGFFIYIFFLNNCVFVNDLFIVNTQHAHAFITVFRNYSNKLLT